jgi:hypothetical protein
MESKRKSLQKLQQMKENMGEEKVREYEQRVEQGGKRQEE